MDSQNFSEKINERINLWKKRLLDLSRRNALISFKDSANSALTIVTPEPEELFNKLVKEKQLSFCCPVEEVSDYRTYAVLRLMEELGKPINLVVGDIKTKSEFHSQQKVLYNLRNKARLAKEEQGTNILYLSFGFIEWKQPDKNDDLLKSPLLMMPVVLSHESANSPYLLSIGDDEIEVNPALDYLMNTYGTDLPTFELTDDTSLSNYFNIIDELIAPLGWRLVKQVSLGLFSFLKISMYHDLETNRQRIISAPVVRALNGDVAETEKLNSLIDKYKDFDLDEDYDENGDKLWHLIVDADSSQQKAILYAKKGLSFVLQGPPGTGKSQTIANIIAESIADGKKVLFVSEKSAALQVVYRRLQECGLGDFCLPLHSHKAGKKEVITAIGNNLSLTQTRLNENAEITFSNLITDKHFLNKYASELHDVVNPIGLTLYEILKKIISLRNVVKIEFAVPKIKSIYPSELHQLIAKIQSFEKAIKNLSVKPNENAWFGFTGEEKLTGELFKDKILTRTKELDFHILALTEYIEKNSEIFGNHKSLNFNKVFELETMLKLALLPETNYSTAENTLKSVMENLNNVYKPFNAIVSALKINLELNLNNMETVLQTAKTFLSIRSICSAWFNKGTRAETKELLGNALQHKAKYDVLTGKLFKDWLPESLELDAVSMLHRYKTEYSGFFNGFFKIFSEKYYRDVNKIKSVSRSGDTPHTSEAIDFLQLVKECQNEVSWFEENREKLVSFIGKNYCKATSDWNEAQLNLLNFEQFEAVYANGNIAGEVVNILLGDKLSKVIAILQKSLDELCVENIDKAAEIVVKIDENGDIRNTLEVCSKISPTISEQLDNLRSTYKYGFNVEEKVSLCQIRLKEFIGEIYEKLNSFAGYFYNIDALETPLHQIRTRYINCCGNFMQHELYFDYAQSSYECMKLGLKEFVEAVTKLEDKNSDFVNIFEKGFYKQLFISALESKPEVAGFRRSVFEEVYDRFVKNDERLLKISKTEIYSKTVNRFPQKDSFTVAGGEVEILRHEVGKTRNLMPLRKLFKKIPNLLMTLKPCFMMSPLTVAYFLDADIYSFDLVVFDEASQVFPEDAVGAILRAKQVIIAGDSKQLPPTNFFKTSNTDQDDYDIEVDDDSEEISESILEEAAVKLPSTTLLWHYRSRHEDLIAFSNKALYEGNLITFPANNEFEKDTGIDFIFDENGVYEGKGTNSSEAKLCARLVEEHIKTNPNRSLGVIAFSKRQETAIAVEIQNLRKRHDEYEWFFDEHKDDCFFVKNLENVQGDERDTIFLSVGYGKTAEQKAQNKPMYMRFGPLGQLGGERRLNVAITRARHNLKIIASIKHTDIGEASSEGVKLLRDYLKFAEFSDDNFVASKNKQYSDSIIDDIAEFLTSNGFKIHKNFGCSDKGVDIAVEHPESSERFILAIEIDGRNFSLAKTAKDRERLRKSVLERMGWNVYRIWSTGWFMNQELEKSKLLDYLNQCIEAKNTDETMETPQQETIEENYAETVPETIMEDSKDSRYNPYGFAYIGLAKANERVVKIPVEGEKQRSIENIPDWELDLAVEAVTANVYGILPDDLMKAVCKALKYSRTTDKMKKFVSKSIERLIDAGKLTTTSDGKVKRIDE